MIRNLHQLVSGPEMLAAYLNMNNDGRIKTFDAVLAQWHEKPDVESLRSGDRSEWQDRKAAAMRELRRLVMTFGRVSMYYANLADAPNRRIPAEECRKLSAGYRSFAGALSAALDEA